LQPRRIVRHLFYWEQEGWGTFAHIHHTECPQVFHDWAGVGTRLKRATWNVALRKRPLCPVCRRIEDQAYMRRRVEEFYKYAPTFPRPGGADPGSEQQGEGQ
jgi:hypothetical protein